MKKIFSLYLTLGTMCNYTCSYCSMERFKNKNVEKYKDNYHYFEIMDAILAINRLKKIKDYINRRIQNSDISEIIFIGGEPTLYPLIELYDMLDIKFNKFSVCTNFSKPLNYFLTLKEECDKRNIELELTCSFHEEFTKLDSFFEKYKEIRKLIDYCKIQFTLTNKNYEYLNKLAELIPNIKDLNVQVCRAPNEQGAWRAIKLEGEALNAYSSYNNNIRNIKKNIFDKTVSELAASTTTALNIKGKYCSSPQIRLGIDFDRELMTLSKCFKESYSLYKDVDLIKFNSLKDDYVLCTHETCPCFSPRLEFKTKV